jgi:hypothetical protein
MQEGQLIRPEQGTARQSCPGLGMNGRGRTYEDLSFHRSHSMQVQRSYDRLALPLAFTLRPIISLRFLVCPHLWSLEAGNPSPTVPKRCFIWTKSPPSVRNPAQHLYLGDHRQVGFIEHFI